MKQSIILHTMLIATVLLCSCSNSTSSASTEGTFDADLSKIAKGASFPKLNSLSKVSLSPTSTKRVVSESVKEEEYCSEIPATLEEQGSKGSGNYSYSKMEYVDKLGKAAKICASNATGFSLIINVMTIEEVEQTETKMSGTIALDYSASQMKMDLDIVGGSQTAISTESVSYKMKGQFIIDLQGSGSLSGEIQLTFGFLDDKYTCSDLWKIKDLGTNEMNYSCDIMRAEEKVGKMEFSEAGFSIKNKEGKIIL